MPQENNNNDKKTTEIIEVANLLNKLRKENGQSQLPSPSKQTESDPVLMNLLKGIFIALVVAGISSSIVLYKTVGVIENKIERIEKLEVRISRLELQLNTLKEQERTNKDSINEIREKVETLQSNKGKGR